MVDAGVHFPTPMTSPQQGDDNAVPDPGVSDPYAPRIVQLPTHPHVIVASTGILNELHFSPHDIHMRGLNMTLFMVNQWYETRHTTETCTVSSKRRREESSPLLSARATKRRTRADQSSGQVWYPEPPSRDTSPEIEAVKTPSQLVPSDCDVGDKMCSVTLWIPSDPIAPASPSASPTLDAYRYELAFVPPRQSWTFWPQHWRDVVIQSS